MAHGTLIYERSAGEPPLEGQHSVTSSKVTVYPVHLRISCCLGQRAWHEETNPNEWERLVAEYDRGFESRCDFCVWHGLATNPLDFWKRRWRPDNGGRLVEVETQMSGPLAGGGSVEHPRKPAVVGCHWARIGSIAAARGRTMHQQPLDQRHVTNRNRT
jgi:hypothetical protein